MKLKSIFATSLAVSLLALPLMGTAANAAAPANDNIASAAVASAPTTLGTTADATKQGSEYDSGNNQFQSTAWFYWIAGAAESTTISTCDSSLTGTEKSTRMNVYTEANVGYVAPSTVVIPTVAGAVASTTCTNGETVTFTAQATKRYYIQVLTKNGPTNEGTFTINIGAGAPATPPEVMTALEKVTICHRTHATTNPYRLITVSTSSIVAANSTVNGHGQHNSKSTRLGLNGGAGDGIFNPPYAKPSLKHWGDIIPPFKAVNGGTFPGLNWKWSTPTYTDAIFDKTEFKAIDADTQKTTAVKFEIDALKACQGVGAEMTDKELFNLERKNGQPRDEILSEYEDADKTELLKDIPAREGPKNEPVLANLPNQSLAGVVWLDLNENGFQEDNEPNQPNIEVTVSTTDPAVASGISPQFGGPSIGRGAAATVRWPTAFTPEASELSGNLPRVLRTVPPLRTITDANGAYLFPSIGVGDWTVVGVVPAGLNVTYDSAGEADASVDVTVPSGSSAFTWVGLVNKPGYTAPTGSSSGTTTDASKSTKTGKAATKLADTGIADERGLLVLLGLAIVLLGISSYGLYRTRENA